MSIEIAAGWKLGLGESAVSDALDPNIVYSNSTSLPEYLTNLMLHILRDALEIVLKGHPKPGSEHFVSRNKLYQETMMWLISDDMDWIFSFCRICEALDVGPDDIRKKVLQNQGKNPDHQKQKVRIT